MTQPQAAAVLAGFVVLALLGMWWGWAQRGYRHRDLPPLATPPGLPGWVAEPAEGVYVGTTIAGDWLDRVVVHGLGARSRAVLRLATEGVIIERQGSAPLFIATAALRGVRRDRALAGTVVEEGGLIVLTWQHGDRLLDTGFRPRRVDDDLYPRLATAIGGAR